MKKWILSAVFIIALSGFAAAQKTSAVVKKGKEDTKKGLSIKKGSDSTLVKKEETTPIKLSIATPIIAVTDAPVIKQ